MTEAALLQTRKEKFRDPDWTASGERRAQVPLQVLRTLWINTGSLCNIECRNCYIESSPENDRLAYVNPREVSAFVCSLGARAVAPAASFRPSSMRSSARRRPRGISASPAASRL